MVHSAFASASGNYIMPAGLQVWDANGLLIVDTSMMVPRSVLIGEVTGDGSASIVPIAQGSSVGVPIVVPLDNTKPPEATLDGATLRWRGNGGGSYKARISVALL